MCAPYSDFGGKGILVQREDVLDTEELALFVLVTLDTFEVPTRRPHLAGPEVQMSVSKHLVWKLAL